MKALFPASAMSVSYGEFEEYAILLTNNAGINVTWSTSGALGSTVASGATATHVAVNNGATAASVTYTAIATVASTGCYSSLNGTAITVNASPSVPTNASTTPQCGTPTFTASSSISGSPVYKWYTASSGGTALQSSTSTTYVYNSFTGGGATNTLWVSVVDPVSGCESGRAQFDVVVNTPDALTISQTGTVATCVNRIETLSVTAGSSTYTTLNWAPITSLYIDAAATVAYNGTGNPTTVYYKNQVQLPVKQSRYRALITMVLLVQTVQV